MSSDVTIGTWVPLQIIYPRRALPPYRKAPELPPQFQSLLQHSKWRPTWPADQPAYLASAMQLGGPVRPLKWNIDNPLTLHYSSD